MLNRQELIIEVSALVVGSVGMKVRTLSRLYQLIVLVGVFGRVGYHFGGLTGLFLVTPLAVVLYNFKDIGLRNADNVIRKELNPEHMERLVQYVDPYFPRKEFDDANAAYSEIKESTDKCVIIQCVGTFFHETMDYEVFITTTDKWKCDTCSVID